MPSQFVFRPMHIKDWKEIQALSGELGYPVEEKLLKIQIKHILRHQDHQLLICLSGETIVGFAHLIRTLRLWSTPRVELAALVVAEPWRGRGIGRSFITGARGWFGETGIIRVRCNTKRKDSHEFYLSMGFSLQKQQKVYDLTFEQNADHTTSL